MRGDCVRHSVAFFVHGMLVYAVEHVINGDYGANGLE